MPRPRERDALVRAVIGRAAELQHAAPTDAELASLAAEVGIGREHLDEALRQVLAERTPSRLSLRLRRWGAAALGGSGVIGLTLWNHFRGAPADFLVTLAALVLIGAGVRLFGPRGPSGPEP
jgi:hypothetical protein